MLLEVIGICLKDVKAAEKYHADRVELCQSIAEDGLTPSYGLIKSAVEAVNIPINVMVRPHNKSFVYDKDDLIAMCHDIQAIKQIGANGIVIGPLTQEGIIDEPTLKVLLEAADGLEVTFHRAFDFVRDQMEALETILKYKQITTILTAGGDGPATDSAANLIRLIEKTKGTHLTIMPGHGLRIETLRSFYEEVQPEALHFGSGVREDFDFDKDLSKEQITRIKELTKAN